MSVQNFWQVGKRGDYQIAQGASFCQHTERKDAEGKESMWQVKALPLTWTCNAGFWTVLVLCSLFALALYPGVGFLSPHQPFNLLFLVIICAGVRKSFTTWSCWWRRGGEAGLYTDSPSSYPTPLILNTKTRWGRLRRRTSFPAQRPMGWLWKVSIVPIKGTKVKLRNLPSKNKFQLKH